MVDSALLLTPLLMLNVGRLSIRYFPKFRNPEKSNHGFLRLLLRFAILGLVIFSILFFILLDKIGDKFAEKHPYFGQFTIYILPIAILTTLAISLGNYISNFKRIVVPFLLNNMLHKIWIPLLVLLFVAGFIKAGGIVWGVIAMFGISSAGLILYLSSLEKIRFGPVDKTLLNENKREMIQYTAYGLLGGLGAMMATRIDSVMVSSLVDFSNNGAYNIGLFIANIIMAPALAINAIAAPIISYSYDKGDIQEINKIYRQSSLILLTVGIGFFVAIICSVDDLISFFPPQEEFAFLFSVILFLGLSRLVDLSTSINNQIIIFSRYYKFNLVALVILGALNVGMNIFFISTLGMGMVGAAVATAISLTLYNAVKFLFIYWKLRIQPFTWNTLGILGIGLAVFCIGFFLSLPWSPVINIIVRSVIICGLYFSAVFFSGLSPQFNQYIWLFIDKLRALLKRSR